MEDVVVIAYPDSPGDVPADLRRPSKRYRRRAAAAGAALAGFLLAYLGLMGWFGWTGVQLVWSAIVVKEHQWGFAAGGAALVIAGVLASSFVRRRPRPSVDGPIEVTAAEQPTLFAFVRRVAAEVGAPPPDRVLITAAVRAYVVHEPGRWWRLERSRRTLMLGLGMITGLDLREFKALLAHELGHVGHHTTWLGRWSTRGGRLADLLIDPRPWFRGGVSLDLPYIPFGGVGLAVIVGGAIVYGLAWSIRAVTMTLFGWTLRLQRAFERECELEADLAAVAVAGSDAVATLLFRSAPLREQNAMAIGFAEREAARGRAVVDVFAVQARIAEQLPAIRGRAHGGQPPAPTGDPAQHRLFTPALAALPATWTTHPSDLEREQSAKARYVAAPAESRPAWAAFDDPAALRARVTARALLRRPGLPALEPTPVAETLAHLDEALGRPGLDPRYRGLYVERGLTRTPPRTAATPLSAPLTAVADLYPPELADELAARTRLRDDRAALDGLAAGALTAGGPTVRYRDRSYGRAELPTLRATIEAELVDVSQRIADREARARAVHRQIAAQVSPAWADYLRSLWTLWHWAEHTHAEIDEAVAEVTAAFAPVVARGSFKAPEHQAVVANGHRLAHRFAAIQASLAQLRLPPGVRARLDTNPWFGAFGYPLPQPPPMGDPTPWLHLAMHVCATATDALADLAAAARDELLAVEDRVVAMATAPPAEPVVAPIIAQVPDRYALHVREVARPAVPPPSLRERWRRPARAVARTAAATALVGGIAVASHYLRRVDVVAYNGTGGPITVTIDGERRAVAAGDYAVFKVGAGRIAVAARTADGTPIEAFHERIDERHRYVYDVAAAMPLEEVTLVYTARRTLGAGDDDGPPTRVLPLRRWQAVDADWLFITPPETTELRRKDEDKSFTLVRGVETDDPTSLAGTLDGDAFDQVLEAQLRWRPIDARFTAAWWAAGADLGGFAGLLERRLARSPDDPLLRTIEQDHAGPRHAAVCADHRARAAARPDDPSWQYLAARCLPLDQRAAAMDAARQRWLGAPWLTLGAGQAEAARGHYAAAAGLLATACRALPTYCDEFALDVVRARRAAPDGPPAFAGLPLADGPHAFLVNPAPDAWWLQLAAGRLDAAVATATRADWRDAAQARWLAAASAGATPAHLADAEANAADAASTPAVALLAFALRHRAGRAAATDLDEAAHAAASDGGADAADEAAAVRGFLTLLTAADGAHVDAAASALADVRLVVRGRAYAAAVVLLGADCPPPWRLRATQLLFDHERPAFPLD
ncbi:MAG: hypothetical protein JNK64_27360 [Myxococcales bacterium]|nr:hypothetical protein [Myxococcales bacterium]